MQEALKHKFMTDKQRILQWLLKEGWHISDGVDPCSGEDVERQEKSVERLIQIIQNGRHLFNFRIVPIKKFKHYDD